MMLQKLASSPGRFFSNGALGRKMLSGRGLEFTFFWRIPMTELIRVDI